MPWAAVPPSLPACRSMLRAAAFASDLGSGPGLTCEILSVPWPVSWPDTSHALNSVLDETTFRPALFAPPSAAKLKTATWSPGVTDVDFALTATPEDTIMEIGLVVVLIDAPFDSTNSNRRVFGTTAGRGCRAVHTQLSNSGSGSH